MGLDVGEGEVGSLKGDARSGEGTGSLLAF